MRWTISGVKTASYGRSWLAARSTPPTAEKMANPYNATDISSPRSERRPVLRLFVLAIISAAVACLIALPAVLFLYHQWSVDAIEIESFAIEINGRFFDLEIVALYGLLIAGFFLTGAMIAAMIAIGRRSVRIATADEEANRRQTDQAEQNRKEQEVG